MAKRRRPESAAEFMERLRATPSWVQLDQDREMRHAERAARLRAETQPEEEPILAELAAVGVSVGSVWDLVNASTPYPAAIPILTKHLALARHASLRQGLARALTVPEARGIAGAVLLHELVSERDSPGGEARWALANALTVAADKTMKPQIAAICDLAAFADVRERLSAALSKL